MSDSVLTALGLADTDTARIPTKSGSRRLRAADYARIARLTADGLSAAQVADACGWHVSTIYDALEALEPTVDLAAKLLEGQALPASLRIVDMLDSKNDRVVLEAGKTILGANNLLGDSKASTTNNIQVVIGMPALEQILASTERDVTPSK